MQKDEKLAMYVFAGVFITWVIVSWLPDYTLLWNV